MNGKGRIDQLRLRCLERKNKAWRDIAVPRAQVLREAPAALSWQERQGLCNRQVLSDARLEIDDLELLAGRLAPRPPDLTDDAIAEAYLFLKQYPGAGGQTGHCELDLRRVMEAGLDGLAGDLRNRLVDADTQTAETIRSFQWALEGLSLFIEHAAGTARDQIPSSPVERQRDLQEIADSCAWIAHRPPRSFRDAIQLLWLCNLAVQYGESVWLVGPGHLDRSLRSFYEADLAAGLLTRNDALLLIESLYLLVNEFIPDGLAIPVMVGGRDVSGRDMTNDLSYLSLEALRRTKLSYPTVGVCWHDGTPGELTELAIELISEGYSTPAFFGDDTIQRGLRALGVPPEDAGHYINSTCVEITPVGGSNVWVASPYFNLCDLLLQEIAVGAEFPPDSFDTFKTRYFNRLEKAVAAAVGEQNRLRMERDERGRKPLQSVFTRDCISRGRDIDCGGAVYNWVECSFVGLANLADSLYVIRDEIFGPKRMSFQALKDILGADFKDRETDRLRFLNAYPKYGQDHEGVDALVGETVSRMAAICSLHRMRPDNSPFVPGSFVWIMHERLGGATGATPDGRRAGKPFADGAGPAQGREVKGPTAAILSTTRWDHSALIGGVAFNMKFNASLFKGSPDSRHRLRDLVLTYLRRGGFEAQVNVVDRDTLQRARERPEEYRDLVVRIGGYTDYFTRLSRDMQDEVMLRTEYQHV